MFFKSVGTRLVLVIGFIWCVFGVAHAQHQWQDPPERDMGEVQRIMGPVEQTEPSRDLNIVWVWGVDYDHERGFHEYPWVMDLFVNKLLPTVPKVTAEHVMYFPTDEQWAKADLVVFYHHAFEVWGDKHYAEIEAFQKRGGGLVIIHESTIQRPGEALAKCIGLAWGIDSSENGRSGWGLLPSPVSLTEAGESHPIFERFPESFELVDEFYWNLTGKASRITPMITSPAGPGGGTRGPHDADELDGEKWPVMWTQVKGKGKLFVTVPGHNYFMFNDPYFRIILLRAMAWTMDESFDPFKPLVTMHLGEEDD